MADQQGEFRSGIVAVVGKPNVGKSTLVNHVVGQKVSIVSDKAQTTRKRILGISTTGARQIVFVDTPGIHQPHHRLGKVLNETARIEATTTTTSSSFARASLRRIRFLSMS